MDFPIENGDFPQLCVSSILWIFTIPWFRDDPKRPLDGLDGHDRTPLFGTHCKTVS